MSANKATERGENSNGWLPLSITCGFAGIGPFAKRKWERKWGDVLCTKFDNGDKTCQQGSGTTDKLKRKITINGESGWEGKPICQKPRIMFIVCSHSEGISISGITRGGGGRPALPSRVEVNNKAELPCHRFSGEFSFLWKRGGGGEVSFKQFPTNKSFIRVSDYPFGKESIVPFATPGESEQQALRHY